MLTGWKKWALIAAGVVLLLAFFVWVRNMKQRQEKTPQEVDEGAAVAAKGG